MILTVIATLLALHLIRPVILPPTVQAQGIIDLDIREVAGKRVRVNVTDMSVVDSGIPVFITKDKDR